MNGTMVTFVGNLTDDPETKTTPNGTSVTNARVAVNTRNKVGPDQWEDGEATFYRLQIWKDTGENVAKSLHKGDRVLVAGKLKIRTWEDSDGNPRVSFDVTVDEIGASMQWATLTVSKVGRSSSGSDAKPSGAGDFDDAPPF